MNINIADYIRRNQERQYSCGQVSTNQYNAGDQEAHNGTVGGINPECVLLLGFHRITPTLLIRLAAKAMRSRAYWAAGWARSQM